MKPELILKLDQYKHKAVVLSYIKGTWISSKEKFVTAWTCQVMHFANRATSRGKGAHSTIKKYV